MVMSETLGIFDKVKTYETYIQREKKTKFKKIYKIHECVAFYG